MNNPKSSELVNRSMAPGIVVAGNVVKTWRGASRLHEQRDAETQRRRDTETQRRRNTPSRFQSVAHSQCEEESRYNTMDWVRWKSPPLLRRTLMV